MNSELTSIAFDHYQRYASAARVISEFKGEISSVLEVGANRQRLLAQFLPDVRFVFSDLVALPEMDEGFVQADATALPFVDFQFDAAVCLDVIEHMPREVRARAVAEMVRVSRRLVIVAFPVDRPWVHAAEARAGDQWRHLFGTEYPWLEEHQEFGLVDGDQIETAFLDSGMKVLRFGHADVDIWSGMMAAHFTKEKFPELAGLVAAADRLYNRSVFPGDRGENCYREFFLGVRNDSDLALARSGEMFHAAKDEQAAAMLAGLGDSLRPLADRVLRAEAAWSDTARYAREVEASSQDLLERAERRALALEASSQETLRYAERSDAHAAKVTEEWRLTVERVSELEQHAAKVTEEWRLTVNRVHELEQQLRELNSSLEKAREDLTLAAHENARLKHRQRRFLQAGAAALVIVAVVAAVFLFWIS